MSALGLTTAAVFMKGLVVRCDLQLSSYPKGLKFGKNMSIVDIFLRSISIISTFIIAPLFIMNISSLFYEIAPFFITYLTLHKMRKRPRLCQFMFRYRFLSSIRLRSRELMFIIAVFMAFMFSSRSPFSMHRAMSTRN